MERRNLKNGRQTVVALCVSIAMFCTPLLAQQADPDLIAQARVDAERDAAMRTNTTLWFAAGCCVGITGLIVSYIYEPAPPATGLLGKSPEYVAYYTEFYKAKAKQIQTKQAQTGCITGAVTYAALYAVSIVLAESSY